MKPKEFPKELWLLGGIFILAAVVVISLLWSQKNNIDIFAAQINSLKQPINALPATVVHKDKIALQIDQLTLEKDRISAQNAIVGIVVQAIGAGFFFISAYLTLRSLKVAEENLRATQQKQETERSIAEANLKAIEEKQVTERFSKAIELLGNDKLAVRLGGIYALERIAKDSPIDYSTIMEVLTSFVREESSRFRYPEIKIITKEVQAAITVIGRRNSSTEEMWQELKFRPMIDLNGTNLSSANLYGANLSGANLYGVNFSGANLIEANLNGANLIEANFSGAFLSGAKLRSTDLKGANLSEAIALTVEQISTAITDEKTKLPDYLQSSNLSQPEPPDSPKPLV